MAVRVTLNFKPVTAAAVKVVESALGDVAEVCLADANTTVPLEESPLQGSGHVSGSGLSREVGYGTPYAVVQHEDESLTHDAGRRARWLELTVYEEQDRYAEYIAARVRAVLG